MMSVLFDDDWIQEMHERSIKREAREEGFEKGREEARYEAVDRFVAGGVCCAAKACEIIGVDPEAYLKYKERLAAEQE